jgi:hypothetical protein
LHTNTSSQTKTGISAGDALLPAGLQSVPDQKVLERERSRPRRLSQFDQIRELTNLKELFDFLYEVSHHPLRSSGDGFAEGIRHLH